VPVDNIRVQGELSAGKPVVAWTGAPVSNPAPEAPFTVESTAENTTIKDLRIDPLVPNANGVDVLGGSNHEVLNNDIRGVNLGSPGVGVFVTGVTNPVNVSGNDIANKSIGVEFDGVDNGFVTDNVITDNDLDGVHLSDSNNNTISGNEVLRNEQDGILITANGEDNIVEDNTANDNGNIGIHLDNTNGNDLVDNTVFNNGFHGVVLENIADFTLVEENEITDNTGHGLYLNDAWDNDINNNTIVNNDADGLRIDISINNQIHDNEITDNGGDGILLRDSDDNTASDNHVENNQNGIVINALGFGADSLATSDTRIQPESVEVSGNTFTSDTSRNNDNWDFVVYTQNGGNNILQTNPDNYPVTNLNIGASTSANTTLSFNADNIRLRSVGTPQPDPADAANIGRYFEAEPVPETTGSFLNVSLSYEDSDVAGLDESALTLLRFNASEWQDIPGSLAEPGVNLVSANITQFSEFGAFVEGAEGEECINRRNLGRGQEDQECPFDRGISRGGSREGIDRDTGRGGDGEHRDSATSRRNRGR
jgi:parallel beta-helix repeat protein